MSMLGCLCGPEIIEDSQFSCRNLMLGPRHKKYKCSDLHPGGRLVLWFGYQGENTHYQTAYLLVNRHLLHHLLSLSMSERVLGY